MKRKYKIGLSIVIFLIVIPLIYLAYDRSLMPPEPEYQSPPFVPGETWEQYASRFLETSKNPNALEHYLTALSLFSTESIPWTISYDMTSIQHYGWMKPYPQMEEVLSLNQLTLQEMLRGGELQHCELPPPPFGARAPLSMNFVKINYLSKFMVVSGKKLEQEHRPDEALRWYLSGMQFGADIGQKGQNLLFSMIGQASILIPDRAIRNLIAKDKLTDTDYRKIIVTLSRIEKELPAFDELCEIEYRVNHTNLYLASNSPLSMASDLKLGREIKSIMPSGEKMRNSKTYEKEAHQVIDRVSNKLSNPISYVADLPLAAYLYFNRGHILRNEFDFYQKTIAILTTKSYRDFMHFNWSKTTKLERDYLPMALENYKSSFTRQRVTLSLLRLTQIQAAIQLYHLEKKQSPKELDDLKPYLVTIPVDPFTDKPFLWTQDSTGRSFAYSTGPDFKDDSAKLVYDPTNGTTSQGDIVLN
jgi:hypothetical protein